LGRGFDEISGRLHDGNSNPDVLAVAKKEDDQQSEQAPDHIGTVEVVGLVLIRRIHVLGYLVEHEAAVAHAADGSEDAAPDDWSDDASKDEHVDEAEEECRTETDEEHLPTGYSVVYVVSHAGFIQL